MINNRVNNTSFKANLITNNVPDVRFFEPAIREMQKLFAELPDTEGDTVLFTTRKLDPVSNKLLGMLHYYESGRTESNMVKCGNIGTEMDLSPDANKTMVQIAQELINFITGQ